MMKYAILIVCISMALFGCKEEFYCANGVCVCDGGADCDMECAAPPCEAVCVGDGTTCDGECANSTCTCGAGAECTFDCPSGPCHVNCEGNAFCAGVCANGTCTCSPGSNCEFGCLSGPCLVNCEGNNSFCNGIAANGTSTCGPNSSCRFGCLDDDCHIVCEAGASCVLHCPNANAGVQGCSFASCAAGEPVLCPGGFYTTCNAPCPTDTDATGGDTGTLFP